MVDLSRKVEAEKEKVEEVQRILEDPLGRPEKGTIELAAIGTFIHNIYNGIENILKQIIAHKGREIPRSENWHKDLLELAVLEPLSSQTLPPSSRLFGH